MVSTEGQSRRWRVFAGAARTVAGVMKARVRERMFESLILNGLGVGAG